MWLLYDLLIHLYGDAISIASLFNPKARQWVKGRRGILRSQQLAVGSQQSAVGSQQRADFIKQSALNTQHSEPASVAWFHCASLGEFEQGRPVLEAFRKAYPNWKIVLTFFSPSGYEIRKNYDGANWIFYLPLDTPRNARRFIRLVNPSIAVFVKYEFWFHYLDELNRNNIPVIIISANFRPNQYFFKWYGSWGRKQLKKVTHYFVQHEDSAQLLRNNGIEQVTVSGDTRFDRVAAISKNAKQFPLIEKFCRQMPVFLAGSTWPDDEALIMELIKRHGARMKFIIAPHEVGKERVAGLESAVGSRKSAVGSRQSAVGSQQPGTRNQEPGIVLFSRLTEDNASSARILIVDGIGYLSHLYQYATVAYIGGGFGAGIHNILEAAAFGKPVIFGPKYQKFREAVELIREGGAFSITDFDQLNNRTIELFENQRLYRDASSICSDYIRRKVGATDTILSTLNHFIDTKTRKH